MNWRGAANTTQAFQSTDSACVPKIVSRSPQGSGGRGRRSDQLSFRYGIPLFRSETGFHELRIGYDFKSSNNNLEFGGTSVSQGVSEIHQAIFEYSGTIQDRFGTTSPMASLVVSPGDLSPGNTTQAFQSSGGGRAGATANYVYGRIGLERTMPAKLRGKHGGDCRADHPEIGPLVRLVLLWRSPLRKLASA